LAKEDASPELALATDQRNTAMERRRALMNPATDRILVGKIWSDV